MKKSVLLSASLVALSLSGWLSAAHADSADAMCQVRKDGETKQGQSGPCTFSQRQGLNTDHGLRPQHRAPSLRPRLGLGRPPREEPARQ